MLREGGKLTDIGEENGKLPPLTADIEAALFQDLFCDLVGNITAKQVLNARFLTLVGFDIQPGAR
ncbi:MAG: hypothetical protein Fur0022_01270 [Anaerolineales bacterium]